MDMDMGMPSRRRWSLTLGFTLLQGATNVHAFTLRDTPVRLSTALAFDLAVSKAEAAIVGAGLSIFARIDHAQAAAGVGLAMPPTLVLVYGNARAGTPVMLACPDAALELPLRVLLRAAPDGGTRVVFDPIAARLIALDVPPDLSGRLAPAQQLLVDTFA